ncbi:MAG: cell wall metabolism sensor histidine kinase WalK [Firmicutes bacterium]|nr:cell wall metabolism sensor histidine kinase WalK [Bacillota bacterium]
MAVKVSIRTRLIVSYITVTVLSLGVLGVLFSSMLSDYLFTEQEKLLLSRGQAVVEIVKDVVQGRPLTFQARMVLENLSDFLQAHVWLVDRSGLVVATSSGSTEWEGLRLDAHEFSEVMNGTVVTRRGRSGRFKTPMVTVAVPITVGNQVLGALFMYTPVSAVTQTVDHVRRLVFAAALFALVVSNLVGLGLSRSITGPLRAMTDLAQEMTRGVFGRRVPVDTQDELGELGEAINLLAENLEKSLADLQEERDKFQSIVSGIDEGVIAASTEEQLLWINSQARELLRIGHIPLEKLKLDDLPVPLLDLFRKVSTTGQVEVLDVSPFPMVVLRAYGSPIRRRDELVGSVILLQDVSEARRLENMRRDFLANVTHELRTPLTSIRGFVEPLLDGTVSDEKTRERYLGIVRDEAPRLSRLIDDILDLAKLESGSMSIAFDLLDIRELVFRVQNVFGPQAANKGIDLRSEVTSPKEGEEILVLGDSDRLQQVLTNFLDNALRYTESGGVITVSVEASDTRVIVKVSDTGSGIDPEELPYVWERFYKADKSREKSKKGTGLGLAISRGIIENHGGEVFATSKPGEGATFGFVIPRAET